MMKAGRKGREQVMKGGWEIFSNGEIERGK